MKVLIVDDQQVNLRLLHAQMEAAGHDVVEASDGIEALEVLRQGPVDVVISDILMPRMDGYALCRELRASERWRQLPFIFYSATFTSPADEKLCLELGGDRYLRKPAPAAEIEAMVSDVVAQRSHHAALAPETEAAVMKEYSTQLVNKLVSTNGKLVEALDRAHAGEAHFRALFEAAADGILLVAPDGTCEAANASFAHMLGYSAIELLGMPVERFVAEDYRSRVMQEVAEVRAGRPYRHVWLARRSNGKEFPIEVSASPLSAGRIMVIMRDISERIRAHDLLKASERHYRDLFDLALDSIFLLDSEGRYVDANPAACELTGYSRDELLRMTPRQLAADEEVRRIAPSLGGLAEGQAIRGEWRLRRKDGSIARVDVSARRRDDGLIQAIVRDVTDRQLALEALQRRADELEAFHRLSVGRELRMIELKREVNVQARALGRPEPYDLSFAEKP